MLPGPLGECADMFDKLFWRQGAGRPQNGRGQAQAIEVLHALDVAIKAVHPDRYRDAFHAAADARGYVGNINTFLGRPETERLVSIDYDTIVRRFDFYAARELLEPMLQAVKPLPVIDALIKAAFHEYRLRSDNAPHDAGNLGNEVRSLTVGLIDFLNRAAGAQPPPGAPA